ncbi:MAG TPA: hypothetical protein VHK67_02370 [Rhabdochlamydiaceae bacterium]|jgi:hypothetical protein|nr:hypothetical protein [Rhabdochlamydiaceae bacterium]
MEKRPVLLLELVISLALFSTIIGILFSSYKEFSLVKTSLRKEKEVVLSKQKFQLRLGQIFSQLKTLKIENNACHLSYDHGIDIEKEFNGALEALLLIDKGRLALVTWSEKGTARKEILHESAKSFSFQFFDPKKGDWSSEYPDQKPLLMQFFLDETPFPFFL